eukprot:2452264-Rhodomonas_salina.1
MGSSVSKIIDQNKSLLRKQVLVDWLSKVGIVEDPKEHSRVINVLLDSFTTPPADPVFLWMVEDSSLSAEEQQSRLLLNSRFMLEWVNFPLMYRGIILDVRDENEIVGMATLLSPGVTQIPPWTFCYQIVTIWLPPSMKHKAKWGPVPEKKLEAWDTVEVAKKEVLKEIRPCWYLQAIGVLKSHHGKGLGWALLRAVCALADKTQTPVYLDTESDWHEQLYNKFGFETLCKFELTVEGADALAVRAQTEYIMVRKQQ